MFVNCHTSDGSCIKLDISDIKDYSSLKRKIYFLKYKSELKNIGDVSLITYANIIKDDAKFELEENQVILVMININIEFNKFVTDERFVSLISNEKQRNIMYKILENPLLLENLLAYKYQNEVDIIKGMNFNISDDKIKEYLNKNNGNIELVVGSILNL
jgi:hypothetical protein